MPDQEIIDGLIASYRELNHRIRSADPATRDAAESAASPDSSIMGILRQLRDRELRASQAIKLMLLGESAHEDDEAILSEQQARAATSAVVLLSQFGTAREATLAMVRELPDEVWNQTFQTPRGSMTLHDYLASLVTRDRERLSQIETLLAKTQARAG